MGGTGAILFGSLINADAIIAFCPFVGLTDQFLSKIHDFRHNIHIEKIKNFNFNYKCQNLSKINHTEKNIYIYIGGDALDKKHAELIEDISHIVEIPKLGHGLINIVNSCGELNKIISHYLVSNSLYNPTGNVNSYIKLFMHEKNIIKDVIVLNNNIEFYGFVKNTSKKDWNIDSTGHIYIWITIFDKKSGKCVYIHSQKIEREYIGVDDYCIENIIVPVDYLQDGEYDLVFEIGSKKWRTCEMGYIGCPIYFDKKNGIVEIKKYEENIEWNSYYSDNENLHTAFLCKDRKFIINANTDSYGVFGPFIYLEPGNYEIIFCFIGSPPKGEVTFDIVDIIENNDEVFFKYNIRLDEKNTKKLFRFNFNIPEEKFKIEFRVFSKKGFHGIFDRVLLRKI
ncbi:hypothetical protein Gxy13693_073_001 [Komagataeibacter xylinus NBRC 13693]|uniref:Uncharacterized protein n=2 Tax=Komagataeibacter xylinus TaxID=28448 RepID=A0A0D6QBQ8_KOMXY|nr:hypothetical protein Gxy13693_073_001 [Komagataeibacter xylinus NBRC 13693]